MASAREYFDKSFFLQSGFTQTLARSSGETTELRIEVVQDFEGGSKYVKIFVPESPDPDGLLAFVLDNAEEMIWKNEAETQITMGLEGTSEKVTSTELRFSGRVLVYTPSVIDNRRWDGLVAEFKNRGINLLVRDGEYVKQRAKHETPLAFISHDSRDKDPFVRKLANKLAQMLCPVWYDEFKLQPGDSLRESIERGLKTCPKCVVVLSKNFFDNPGWTKREFDTIYTREIVEGKRVMIPIWLDVEKREIYDYCPILLDTVGIKASLGVDEVALKLMKALS